MSILQDALVKKKNQELLRREHSQKQDFLDIKHFFLDAFSLSTPEETKLIIVQLTSLVEKVDDINLDSNVKLLEFSKRKFQNKVNEKISSVIALS